MGPLVAFDPHAPEARAISSLFGETLILCAVIGAIVAGLVGYCIFRFRARSGDAEPTQVHGNRRLEVLWAVIPLGIVVWLFVLTANAMTVADAPVDRAPDLVVTAHQWWWEARYAQGAVTANEIHIPVGKQLLVGIESADVIHDFWVPQLGRKLDAIPGHPGAIWIEADAPGRYLGACAEFCGAEHAWMRIVVVAESQADFDAWQAHEQQPPQSPPNQPNQIDEAASRGAKLFNDRTCVTCHALAHTGHEPRIAPSLTHLAERETLGAGVLPNTPAELAHWLRDPQGVKPGCHMPDLQLTDAEVTDLVAYLETLR
jgi:cytochrome c oxidase subunit II